MRAYNRANRRAKVIWKLPSRDQIQTAISTKYLDWVENRPNFSCCASRCRLYSSLIVDGNSSKEGSCPLYSGIALVRLVDNYLKHKPSAKLVNEALGTTRHVALR